MPVLCQEYMLLFCLPLSSQPRLNLLSIQQQGRARGGICSGIWSQIFDMSSASGYVGEHIFRNLVPDCLACHVIFGVSCSKCCVSWRVNINRVNNFRVVSCQNSACQHVHAMSWPPWSIVKKLPEQNMMSYGHMQETLSLDTSRKGVCAKGYAPRTLRPNS